jgi:single-strand DNA-binding protein
MLNHVTIQGRLVEDAKCGQTNGGVDFANFRIAWSEKYKEKENKCFLECKAFNAKAKFISDYMSRKGQELVAEGKLMTEQWESEGQKRSKVVLMVSDVHFCGKKDSGTQVSAPAQEAQGGGFTAVETDELPF